MKSFFPIAASLFVLIGAGCTNDAQYVQQQTPAETCATSFATSGLSFEISHPGWCVVEMDSYGTARIRTDQTPYTVDLVLEVTEGFEFAPGQQPVAETEYGDIYTDACGGAFACHGVIFNEGSAYSLVWSINSTEPAPQDLDGIWIPNHSFTQADVLKIVKTVMIQ